VCGYDKHRGRTYIVRVDGGHRPSGGDWWVSNAHSGSPSDRYGFPRILTRGSVDPSVYRWSYGANKKVLAWLAYGTDSQDPYLLLSHNLREWRYLHPNRPVVEPSEIHEARPTRPEEASPSTIQTNPHLTRPPKFVRLYDGQLADCQT